MALFKIRDRYGKVTGYIDSDGEQPWVGPPDIDDHLIWPCAPATLLGIYKGSDFLSVVDQAFIWSDVPYYLLGLFYYVTVVVPFRVGMGIYDFFAGPPGLTGFENLNFVLGLVITIIYGVLAFLFVRYLMCRISKALSLLPATWPIPALTGLSVFILPAGLTYLVYWPISSMISWLFA